MEFMFTLSYRLAAQDCNQEELVERLGGAGCTDAVIGIGRPGCLAMAFSREAMSIEAALFSALEDIKRTIPSAQLIDATSVSDFTPALRRELDALLS